MKLIQRIGYFLVGLSMGLVILAFFFNGKKTSCSYGPESRVIKNINTKTIRFSNEVYHLIKSNTIDSLTVRSVLKNGNVNFSKSETRQKPCGVYTIEGDFNNKAVLLRVENCDSIATIKNVKMLKN